MKILHTSDWHLGRMLYGHKRHDEFQAFLDWLTQTLSCREINVLLVAGDVFDTTAPSIVSLEMYYRFLAEVGRTGCRHVVITSGNHDSPGLLEVPKQILSTLNIHVSGFVHENPADEVIMLKDGAGKPELIVGAVPFLREKDLRRVEAGESESDKTRKLLAGLGEHYSRVGRAIQEISEAHPEIPVVGMGHLFAEGAHTTEGDGVRELYVGSLARAGADLFPACFDYLALGHIHTAQTVGGKEHFRYCGAPIPLGFAEARRPKTQTEVRFEGRKPAISEIPVPVFRKLESVRGDWEFISARLGELLSEGGDTWAEVEYTGKELPGDLKGKIEEKTAGGRLKVLKIKNASLYELALDAETEQSHLRDATPEEVFQSCLEAYQVPEEQKRELLPMYAEILEELRRETGEEGQVP